MRSVVKDLKLLKLSPDNIIVIETELMGYEIEEFMDSLRTMLNYQTQFKDMMFLVTSEGVQINELDDEQLLELGLQRIDDTVPGIAGGASRAD